MMPTNQPPEDTTKVLGQIKEIIAKNDSGLIVLPAKASADAIAAGTSLYMVLTKMGKNVSLVASEIPQSDMVGIDKIKTELSTGGDNLVVSFPYVEGSIDKVDYNIKEERFNLIIIPREGHEKLEPKDVQFTYSGGKIDFIITIDTPNLNAIGDLYTKNQRDFEGSTIINIDRHLINGSYGMVNMVVKTSSSTSELVLKVIKSLKGQLDKDSATNLYAGIVQATNNFTAYSVNADTFESIAELLRAGAVKKPMQPMGGQNPFGGMPPMGGMNPFGGAPQQRPPFPQMNPFQQAQPQPVPQQFNQAPQIGGSFNSNQNNQSQPRPQQQQNNQTQQRPQQQQNNRNEQQQRSVRQVEKEQRAPEGQQHNRQENDLKPKIFGDEEGII